jgi:hypothetical protein
MWQLGTFATVGVAFYSVQTFLSDPSWRYDPERNRTDQPVSPQAEVTDQVYFDVQIGVHPDTIQEGRIVLGLHGNVVPKTVANFVALCRGSQFMGNTRLSFDGSTFHRIIPG